MRLRRELTEIAAALAANRGLELLNEQQVRAIRSGCVQMQKLSGNCLRNRGKAPEKVLTDTSGQLFL